MTVRSTDVRGGHCHSSVASATCIARCTCTPSWSATRRVHGTVTCTSGGTERTSPSSTAALAWDSTAPGPQASTAAECALARPSPRRHPIVHLTSRQTTQERLTSSQDTVLEVRERLHLTAVESRHALQPGQAGHAEAALVHRPEPLSTAREDPPHSAVADAPGKAVSCLPGGSGRRCRRSRGTGH